MKLSIELVPSSAWHSNVRELVTKSRWDTIRKAVYKMAAFRCEICEANEKQLNAHEQWEFENGVQKLARLVCLCSDCHSVKHFGLARIQGRAQEAQDHFCEVNGIDSEPEAEAEIEKAFELWEQKSREDWKLDKESIEKVLKELREWEDK